MAISGPATRYGNQSGFCLIVQLQQLLRAQILGFS